jgi:hypothetical protein
MTNQTNMEPNGALGGLSLATSKATPFGGVLMSPAKNTQGIQNSINLRLWKLL